LIGRAKVLDLSKQLKLNSMSKLRNWEITNRTVYRTTYWTIETHPEDDNGDTYRVQCQEGDMYNTWEISSDKEGIIDINTELGHELIGRCETYEDWYMDSDERMDDGAK
jgi:hypothetical protein